METARIIASHTPVYVWLLFVLLVVLGGRRLQPRRTHLMVAALAPACFAVWSISSAGLLFVGGDEREVVLAWTVPFMAGAISRAICTRPRWTHVAGWTFQCAATALPLALYMLLWVTRYGLGIWAGFVPAVADDLALVGLALAAAAAGRSLADLAPLFAMALRHRNAGSLR
jgi:hypothetical protein